MTNTTLHLELTCGGKRLGLGPGEAVDITKVTGLESSELEVGLSDLAVVDGASLDGRHIKARPIHIEGSFRSLSEPIAKRETLVRFFNPKLTGVLTATISGAGISRSRSIEYELEGWTIKERRNLDARVGFMADLICPDPYFLGPNKTPDSYDHLINAGDVDAGWRAELSGPCTNPRVKDSATGAYMRVLTTLSASDTLIISTEDRKQTITLNGESSFRLIDRQSTPFHLPVGTSSVVITADSGEPAGTVSFRERFFGI